MTVFYLLGEGETVFSETVTLDKVTALQWRTTYPRRFRQHKCALKTNQKETKLTE